MDFVRVGSLAEIPEGEMRAFDLPSGRIAVAHVEARMLAFADECTHAGCALSDGDFDDRAATVTCACHGSVFDVETGEPVAGPPQRRLPRIALRREGDLLIAVEEAP